MKILQYVALSILTVLTGFQVKADWTSVKFTDRVNTAVQNGNVGTWTEKITKVQPRPFNSGWTSVNFIDRVNAWQERVPAKVAPVKQLEAVSVDTMPQDLVFVEDNAGSFIEKAKIMVAQAKDLALDAVKNAYSSPATQGVIKNIQDNKKLVAGFVVGATALYGGYKLYTYMTNKKPVNLETSSIEQEEFFQKQYRSLMSNKASSHNKTAKLVNSMNSEAQISTVLSNATGLLPAGKSLKYYKPSRS